MDLLRHRLVVLSGPKRGMVPGAGGTEGQVYSVARFTHPMLRAFIIHGPRLAIRADLGPLERFLDPRERRWEGTLPRPPFLVKNMISLQPPGGSLQRSWYRPERYGQPLSQVLKPKGKAREHPGARVGPERRQVGNVRQWREGEGRRAAKRASVTTAAAPEEEDEVVLVGVQLARGVGLEQEPPSEVILRRRHEEDSSAMSTGGSDREAPDQARGGVARRLADDHREALEEMDASNG